MGNSCTLKAHVRNPKGEIVESRLFNDLLHYTSNDRELSKEYYSVGTNREFISSVENLSDYKTDENGEITIGSLKTLAKLDFETDKLLEIAKKDIEEGNYSYEDAVKRVEDFNNMNPFDDKVMATMYYANNGKYFVTVVPQKKTVTDINGKRHEESNSMDDRQKLHDVVRNAELEKRIKDLLSKYHVSVEFLDGGNGDHRYDTTNAEKTTEGLYSLIKLSKGGYTTDILAEEAGHFAVGALGNDPLVSRLESLLERPSVQREAIGAEEFDDAQLGRNPKREIAGRLVGKALARKLDNGSNYNVLANRIANAAKRIFARITNNEVMWAAAKAEQIANRIAYGFIEGKNEYSLKNALSRPEVLHSSKLSKNQKVFSEVIDEFGRLTSILESIAGDNLAVQFKGSFAFATQTGVDAATGKSALQMEEKVDLQANALAFDGIVQTLVQICDYFGEGKEVKNLLDDVENALANPSSFYPNMASNGRKLRQARAIINSAIIILSNIDGSLRLNAQGGPIVITSGTSITDVRYQDERNTWHTINMQSMLTNYSSVIAKYRMDLSNLERRFFTRYCEDTYGKKYVTTTTGLLWDDIRNGTKGVGEEKISLEDLVEGTNMDDIDMFHRYLGSMANNPDVIGQIADKVVKSANKTADDITIRYQEKLLILKQRAEKLGLDVADLVDRDEKGVPTGNMITPPAYPSSNSYEEDAIYNTFMSDPSFSGVVPALDYGKWENARDAKKKECWEQFKADNPDWASMSGIYRAIKWGEFFSKEMKDWNAKNSYKVEVTDKSGHKLYVKWIPNAIYSTDKWDKLKAKYPDRNGESLAKWVHDFRTIKEELDSLLPEGATVSYRLPQFRGTFMNTVRNTNALEDYNSTLKGGKPGRFNKIKSYIKTFSRRVVLESFVETADDTDYGDMNTMNSPDEELLGTRLNYEDEKPNRLPIFGINKLKNMTDLSTDLFHSMLAYASMATSYNCLNNVVDALEVGKQALYDRKIQGKKNRLEKIAQNVRRTITRKKPYGDHEDRETGSKNRAYGRYIKFLDKQLYGINSSYIAFTVGEGKRILLGKILQNISSLGGSIFLKGNVLGGAVNSATGTINIFKEAVVSDHYTAKDWGWAHKYYFIGPFKDMWMPGITVKGKDIGGELGKLRKDNKLSLFLQRVNAQGNNREKFREWRTSRSRMNNFFRELSYLPYSSGDHYMQAMSYLAVAHGTNLYDEDGNLKSNLWDAYESKDNTDDFGENPTGKTIEFNRFNPRSATDINTNALKSKGVYLKEVKKSTTDFEDWIAYRDSRFIDDVYKRDHIDDYNDLRDEYDSLSKEELMNFRSRKYKLLASILEKTENYLSSLGPILRPAPPAFTPEELEYLKYRNVGTGNYKDIIQITQNDIYNTIWTLGDESAYMDKCREVNNRLHGIYNTQDKTAWHQNLYTNMLLAMKGWVLGYIEMMYSNNHYSIALERNTEGFINTTLKVLASGINGLPFINKIYGREGGEHLAFNDALIAMLDPWSLTPKGKKARKALLDAKFSEEQIYNIRRMVMSLAVIALLGAIKLAAAPPDDEEEMDVATGLIYYMATRTLFEQEVFISIAETKMQSGSFADLVPVGVAALYDVGIALPEEAFGAMFGDIEDEDDKKYFYQRDDPNGRYKKDDSKFYHHLIRLTPYWKSYWALQNPYEATKNYEFGRKLRTR